MAYAIAVERLAGLEVPARCQAIRVLTAEMARISAHLMGLGAFGLDVGAWSVLVHSLNQREHLYKLFEELTGARFTTSYTRIGGVTRDVPEGAVMVGIPARATMVEGGQKPQEFLAYGTPCSEMFDPQTQKVELLRCELETMRKRLDALLVEAEPKRKGVRDRA
eukprot:gene17628-22480_t